MNAKFNLVQWTIASLAVFVIITIFTFVMIRLGFEPWQSATPEEQVTITDRIGTYLSRLILAGLFTFIFTKTTYEDKSSIGHGLRYGFGMGLLMFVPNFVARIVHADSSFSGQATYMVVGVIQSIVCGAAMAYLYKSDKPKNS